jgi:hypothetical protein
MQTETQGVQKRASAQDALMASEVASKIGQGIGRIGDDQEERLRRRRNDFGNNISVDIRIDIEKFQPSEGVVAVGGTASLFVNTRRDDHERCVGKVRIVAGAEFHCRRECRTVLEIGYDTIRTRQILVYHDHLARNSAHDEGEKTSGAYAAHANDPDFNEGPPLVPLRMISVYDLQASDESPKLFSLHDAHSG